VTDSVGALGLTSVNVAKDASLTVDGVTMTRSSNQITDAIKGVSLTLFAENTSSTIIQVAQDNSRLGSNITNLVAAYNDLQKTLKTLGDSQSSDPVIGGKLANDSLLRQVQTMIRNMVTGDSTSPGGKIKALRDIGVTIQADGSLQTDTTKLQSVLDTNLGDVVTMFTANLGNPANSAATRRGVAGDAVKVLAGLSSPSGLIAGRENNRQSEIRGYNDDMTKLQARMVSLLDRYTKQFAAMDALVGSLNSQKAGLKTTFDNMSALYSNK
jgi:flagellar hook-associated protein 2